jgi:hypothetical protein
MNATELTIQIENGSLAINNWTEAPDTIALPNLSGEDWRKTADESHDNGVVAVHSWKIGDLWLHIYTDQGSPQSASLEAADHLEYLAEQCQYIAVDVNRDRAEIMAGFHIDFPEAFLSEAKPDWKGECRVWHMPNYYSGHNNPPLPHFAREGDDPKQITTFANYADAKAYVENYFNEESAYDGIAACNVLSHGQAGADSLKIVEAE